jgi:hypothetical protein
MQQEDTLARVEQLLREGNELRGRTLQMQQESIALQREAFALQKSLLEEQRANLARAAQVNDGALAVQARARKLLLVVVPVLLVLVGYASWLLFTRPYA